MKLEGLHTALITPFLGEDVDSEGLRKNIRYQIKNGVQGILVLGTTGETPTLSQKEKDLIVHCAVEEAKGQVPIMVGTGCYSTAKTVESSLRAKELGADAALIVTPYYNKPTQEGIFQHFEAVARHVNIPIVVYNNPGRTAKNIETETLLRICQLPNVIGVKEASGDLNQTMDLIAAIAAAGIDCSVMAGDDALCLPIVAAGGHGLISVVSNLVPEAIVALTRAVQEGNLERAQQIHYQLLPLIRISTIESNPIPIKHAMTICGLAAGEPRLPLCEMSEENKAKVEQLLKEMGLSPNKARTQKYAYV